MAGIQCADSPGSKSGRDAGLVVSQCRVEFARQVTLVLLARPEEVKAGELRQAVREADRVALLGDGSSLTDYAVEPKGCLLYTSDAADE